MAENLNSKKRIDVTAQRKALAERQRLEEEKRLKAIAEREEFKGLQVDPDLHYYEEVAHREPGDTNWVGYGFDIHPQVTFVSGAIMVVFIAWTLIAGESAAAVFNSILASISANFGWFYIAAANIFVIAVVFFAFSRFGKIRIGGPNAKPEFSDFAWYSMLISAGMGIGLMFYGVAEPIFHFSNPSPMFGVEAGSAEAAQAAFAVTFLHYGIHPWGIYALVSLALAFFAFNRGLPLTMRSIFYPLLGEKIYGTWGNIIDILSVVATLFGLATTLGFGVQQVAAGLNFLFGWPTDTWFQIVLIAVITGFATMSVVAGLDAGVKVLSEWNIRIAMALLLFVLIVGPTVYALSSFFQNLGYYLQVLPQLSFWTETYRVGSTWQSGWTVFYWGWWISWSPFVGMFIARVSKGRTVKEFVVGVLVLPTLLSFFWMSVFGGTAIFFQQSGVDISRAVNANVATALFEMFQNLPFTGALSIIGILLVITFFVTSSDSGSLVVDHLTSGGKLDSPVPQRVFWAVMEGTIASVLLLGGGLAALQTAAITSGLPLTVVLLIMIYSLYKGFSEELFHLDAHEIKDVIQRTAIDVDILEEGLAAAD